MNKIGYEGAKSISESLKINTSLKSLDLRSDEKIRNEIIEVKEMKMKKQSIDNYIGDEGAMSISESLIINTCLVLLNLGSDEKK